MSRRLIGRGHCRTVLVLVGLGVAACGGSAGGVAPRGASGATLVPILSGCWALTWQAEGDRLAAEPDSIRLREGAVFGSGERLVTPATHPSGREPAPGTSEIPWESRYRLNRWWVEDGRLAIRFAEGERDVWILRLRLEGDGLQGDASHERTPSGERGRQAEVRASRIACQFA